MSISELWCNEDKREKEEEGKGGEERKREDIREKLKIKERSFENHHGTGTSLGHCLCFNFTYVNTDKLDHTVIPLIVMNANSVNPGHMRLIVSVQGSGRSGDNVWGTCVNV